MGGIGGHDRVAACLQVLLSLQSLLSVPAEMVGCCVARPLPQLRPIHQLLALLLLTQGWQGRVMVAAEHKRQLRDRGTPSCVTQRRKTARGGWGGGKRSSVVPADQDWQATPSRPPSTIRKGTIFVERHHMRITPLRQGTGAKLASRFAGSSGPVGSKGGQCGREQLRPDLPHVPLICCNHLRLYPAAR